MNISLSSLTTYKLSLISTVFLWGVLAFVFILFLFILFYLLLLLIDKYRQLFHTENYKNGYIQGYSNGNNGINNERLNQKPYRFTKGYIKGREDYLRERNIAQR